MTHLRLVAQRHECPQTFCRAWNEAEAHVDSACTLPFGACSRIAKDGPRDAYEPHAANLERAGLTRDHFLADRPM